MSASSAESVHEVPKRFTGFRIGQFRDMSDKVAILERQGFSHSRVPRGDLTVGNLSADSDLQSCAKKYNQLDLYGVKWP